MLNTNNYGMYGNNMYGYNQPNIQTAPIQTAQPVYPSQYVANQQQYGAAQQNTNLQSGFIVVHNETEAMDTKYPMNTPLFNDMEDIFYFKTTGTDNIHTVLKKARFVWEEDGVVDAPLIEQKDMSYGDSKADEFDELKKSIKNLTEQVAALGDIVLEQNASQDKTITRTSSTAKKTNSNK